jgi:hypothetical protein
MGGGLRPSTLFLVKGGFMPSLNGPTTPNLGFKTLSSTDVVNHAAFNEMLAQVDARVNAIAVNETPAGALRTIYSSSGTAASGIIYATSIFNTNYEDYRILLSLKPSDGSSGYAPTFDFATSSTGASSLFTGYYAEHESVTGTSTYSDITSAALSFGTGIASSNWSQHIISVSLTNGASAPTISDATVISDGFTSTTGVEVRAVCTGSTTATATGFKFYDSNVSPISLDYRIRIFGYNKTVA